MIFAAATDERTLFVFPSAEDAVVYCEGIDVEGDGWLFWDEAGRALAPEFITPNHRGRFSIGSGKYVLVPAPHNCSLVVTLAELSHLDSNPHFHDFSSVLAHLAKVARTPQHGA
ncbi:MULTISPECIES: hypothetical protein [unclassified Pseudoxanthomonas]|uniref:hypothetical protein n=1 Tax=unclassified Pseudoxanthomonas TaxID=2645906 RepID=UPI0008ED27BC|nr:MULTISPECIES: hypothetical protein [unclassified Pseudoxanthomonas]PPJ43928.1 hypothetical protein C0063_12385 [Pseudoxanthomonas sp. KAs_5_3]SFV36534.1 hypothetical protein SAMN05428990_3549 [Pseudoxanthomonas sp. YR558]